MGKIIVRGSRQMDMDGVIKILFAIIIWNNSECNYGVVFNQWKLFGEIKLLKSKFCISSFASHVIS